MLLAIGPGVAALKDYTSLADAPRLKAESHAGTTLDSFTGVYRDRLNQATLAPEDDLVWLDETDATGWPTCNLLTNPSFEVPYAANGVANGWALYATSYAGISVYQSGSPLYGYTAQLISISNVANRAGMNIEQQWTLPTDEHGVALTAQPYYFSVYLRTLTAFHNANILVNIDWYTSAGAYLSTVSSGPVPGNLPSYTRYTASGYAPATAGSAYAYVNIATNHATNSGTLLIDCAQVEYATFGSARAPGRGTLTAIQAGLYPTTYCDATRPGCYTDRISGLAYRQLRVFGGYVKHLKWDWSQSPEAEITITGVEYGVILQEAPANLVIANQTDVAAIAAAVTYAQNQGYLAGLDATTYVQQLATINAQVFSWQTTKTVLNAIANQTGGIYWVDPYLYLHYGSANALSAPFALSATPDLQLTFPMVGFTLEADSTNSATAAICQGTTQTSAPQNYAATGDGSTVTWTINNSDPINAVTSVSVAGVGLQVGVSGYDTLGANGVTVLADYAGGTLTFATAPANGAAIAAVFTFEAPALGEVHNFAVEGVKGAIRRKILFYAQHPELGSLQSVIDRASGDLASYSKPTAVGTVTVTSPPAPSGVPLRVGQAISITYPPAGIAGQYYLIQEVMTTVGGNGFVQRTLTLGAYRPDLTARLAQMQQESVQGETLLTGPQALNDVLSSGPDGWAMTDSVPAPTTANAMVWGGSTPYGGANVWG